MCIIVMRMASSSLFVFPLTPWEIRAHRDDDHVFEQWQALNDLVKAKQPVFCQHLEVIDPTRDEMIFAPHSHPFPERTDVKMNGLYASARRQWSWDDLKSQPVSGVCRWTAVLRPDVVRIGPGNTWVGFACVVHLSLGQETLFSERMDFPPISRRADTQLKCTDGWVWDAFHFVDGFVELPDELKEGHDLYQMMILLREFWDEYIHGRSHSNSALTWNKRQQWKGLSGKPNRCDVPGRH